jgi:hypothetical protein
MSGGLETAAASDSDTEEEDAHETVSSHEDDDQDENEDSDLSDHETKTPSNGLKKKSKRPLQKTNGGFDDLMDNHSSNAFTYSVEVAMLEIYNETVSDTSSLTWTHPYCRLFLALVHHR